MKGGKKMKRRVKFVRSFEVILEYPEDDTRDGLDLLFGLREAVTCDRSFADSLLSDSIQKDFFELLREDGVSFAITDQKLIYEEADDVPQCVRDYRERKDMDV